MQTETASTEQYIDAALPLSPGCCCNLIEISSPKAYKSDRLEAWRGRCFTTTWGSKSTATWSSHPVLTLNVLEMVFPIAHPCSSISYRSFYILHNLFWSKGISMVEKTKGMASPYLYHGLHLPSTALSLCQTGMEDLPHFNGAPPCKSMYFSFWLESCLVEHKHLQWTYKDLLIQISFHLISANFAWNFLFPNHLRNSWDSTSRNCKRRAHLQVTMSEITKCP